MPSGPVYAARYRPEERFSTGDTVGYSVTNEIYGSLRGVDYLVGFDSEDNHLVLHFKAGEPKDLGRASKLSLANGVLDSVVGLLRERP